MEFVAQDIDREKEMVSLVEALKRIAGPIIEIGGPTLPDKFHPHSYRLIKLNEIPKRLWTVNIDLFHENEEWDQDAGVWRLVKYPSPDIQADGMMLPLGKESVGAVFASALPDPIRNSVLREVHRILEPGGLVIWQYGIPRDIKKARQVGLIKIGGMDSPSGSHDYVFKKPKPMTDSGSPKRALLI